MKTKTICSFFVLFAIVTGIGATIPAAFADHSEVAIETADNDLAVPGCLETEVGCYTPNTVVIGVGGVVTMTNTDSTGIHTYTTGTVDGFTPTPSNVFDSGLLHAGDSFEYITDTVGEIPYYCTLHVWMQGLIIVQDEDMMDDDELDMMMDDDELDMMMDDDELDMMMDDDELAVTITDSVVNDGTQVNLEFNTIHVNYEIIAKQNGEEIFKESGHAMEMTGASHMIDAVGSDESPIDIEIISLGIGPPNASQDWTGSKGTVATTQVVPEFGTIAMMVLAVAIISIIAVTAKSRVIPRF